jgi:hypothetical protein
MRPTPQEVIDGARAVLKDVVAPDLRSDHARARLDEVRIALAQVDWNDAGFTLAARNRVLAAGLADAGPWATGISLDLPDVDSFDAHQATYERLAGELVAVLAGLREHLADRPDDAESASLRERLVRLA